MRRGYDRRPGRPAELVCATLDFREYYGRASPGAIMERHITGTVFRVIQGIWMTDNSWQYGSAFAFLFGIGVLVIIIKVRSAYITGFRFFIFSGLLTGMPYIVLAIVYRFSKKAVQVLCLFAILISRAGLVWGEDREDEAKEKEPEKWRRWISKRDALSVIDQLLLSEQPSAGKMIVLR
jgi:hypothetical protein